MIKAYLAAIGAPYEGEDIEVRYCIYKEQELLCRESVFVGYQKPAVVGHAALVTLLRELEKYKDQEIIIFMNDPAVHEFIRGTLTTKNKDIMRVGRETKKEWNRFSDIMIEDVHKDRAELLRWNEILQH
jgi:hypothetical protein